MTDIKVPPHDIEAEQRVLGAILINNDAMITAVNTLVPDDFYRSGHRLIYEAMLKLWRLKEIDLINLGQELGPKHCEEVGGTDYLAMLAEQIDLYAGASPVTQWVIAGALKVRAFSIQRAVIQWVREICDEMMQEEE